MEQRIFIGIQKLSAQEGKIRMWYQIKKYQVWKTEKYDSINRDTEMTQILLHKVIKYTCHS